MKKLRKSKNKIGVGISHDINKMIVIPSRQKNEDDTDNHLLQLIDKAITDPTKIRKFDCLFISPDKNTAKELQSILTKTHNYKIVKSCKDADGWITNAIKEMIHTDLKNSLDQAKKEAAKYSSRLFDWNFEADAKGKFNFNV